MKENIYLNVKEELHVQIKTASVILLKVPKTKINNTAHLLYRVLVKSQQKH